MNLVKTSFFSAIASFIKIAGGFLTNKLIAIYAGPAGMATIGQFQNVFGVLCDMSNGAILNGTIKYLSENRTNNEERKKYISNSFFISIIFSVFISLLLLIFHETFSIYFLRDAKYGNIFFILGFVIILISINNFIISLLNGSQEIKRLIVLQIVSNLASIVLLTIMVLLWGLYGALLALSTSHIMVFIVSVYFLITTKKFYLEDFLGKFDSKVVKELFKFSFIGIIVVTTLPISQIIIRNYITDYISVNSAGLWQGVMKISEVYLIIMTSSIGIYFYPKVSGIRDKLELRKEILNTFKFVMPTVAILSLIIFFSRDFIIYTIFTKEFLPMKELFIYQLIGDNFKIASWILMTVMISKAMFRKYLATHLFYIFLYICVSIILINHIGLIGSTLAYAASYILLTIFLIFLMKDFLLKGNIENDSISSC